MVYLKKLGIVGFNPEVTPGVYDDSGMSYLPVFDAVYAPEFENEEQNLNLGTLGTTRYLLNCRRPIITFNTYLRGSGGVSGGMPPMEGILYKAAAMEEDIGSDYVGYKFTSDKSVWEWLSCDFWYVDGGNDYYIRMCGGMLNGSMKMSACKPVVINWTYAGKFDPGHSITDFYGDGTKPSFNKALITNPQAPQCLATGGTLLIDSFQPIFNDLTIDFGLAVTPRPTCNERHGHDIPYISDRKTTGSITMELPTVATFDIQGAIVNRTVHTITFTIGTVPGNTITLAMEVQFLGISESNNNGIVMHTVNFGLVDDDDQDFSMIFT
jgi:hypothetical protein